MEYNWIVYFLDCYCLMMNYDEPLEEIVAELADKEDKALTDSLVEQIKAVLSLPAGRDAALAAILAGCQAFEYTPEGLKCLLEVSLAELTGRKSD